MSYEPTTWKKGDKVTSTKLNKIEQGIQGNDSEIGELKSGFSELSARLLNAFPTDIASGSIASFSDGADNLPLKSLVVNINPVQDLHGQESPYPAGGGKNKFNGTFLQGYWAYADGTWVNSPNWITTEKIPCKASTSYTVSADTKMTRWQGFVWYDSNGDFISTDNLNNSVNIGLTKTSPSNAAYLIFNIAGYPGANDTIAPSDVTYFQLEEGSSSTAYTPYSNICPISGWTGMQLNANETVIPISWQTEAGTVYGGKLDVLTGELVIDRAMLAATECLSVSTASTGVLYASVSVATGATAKAEAEASSNKNISSVYKYRANDAPTDGGWFRVITNKIFIFDNRFTDKATADTILSTEQPVFVYELATPLTIQLTPNQVNSFLGVNNIFADTGDTEVEYRANTELWVQRKITEAVAAVLNS